MIPTRNEEGPPIRGPRSISNGDKKRHLSDTKIDAFTPGEVYLLHGVEIEVNVIPTTNS